MKPKMSKITELGIIKNLLIINKDKYYLATKNKKTGQTGDALFYKSCLDGTQKIKVFEGNPDGIDDKEYTYEEFINRYDYEVKEEI